MAQGRLGPSPHERGGPSLYTVDVRVLAASTSLLLAALLAGPAWAEKALPAGIGTVSESVSDLKDAVADRALPDTTVHAKAADLFASLPGAMIVVEPGLRGWDKERAIEPEPASVERLLQSAGKRLSDFHLDVPAPGLTEAFGFAESMSAGGKVAFDKTAGMPDGQMGLYRYLVDTSELGAIKLNGLLAAVATRIGDALAFSTLIHEAGHARDHVRGRLSAKNVIDGEVLAFKTQYEWLKIADPRKERVCWLRAVLAERQRQRPDALTNVALGFLEHLAALQDTDGDAARIRAMVERLGYQDEHDRKDGPVSS